MYESDWSYCSIGHISALPGISPFSLLRVRAAAYPSRAQLLVKACAPVLSQLFQWPALRQWLSGTGTGALSPVPTSPIHAGMGGRAVAQRLRGSAACSGCTCAVSGGLVAASIAPGLNGARPQWRPSDDAELHGAAGVGGSLALTTPGAGLSLWIVCRRLQAASWWSRQWWTVRGGLLLIEWLGHFGITVTWDHRRHLMHRH